LSRPPDKFVATRTEDIGIRRTWGTQLCLAKAVNLATAASLVCALSLVSLFAPLLSAQLQDEHAVKAAFVFNLTKYVEWPQPSQELIIGFVGDGPMGETLQKVLDGKTTESRPIRVLLFPPDGQLQQCNILYIAQSAPKKIRTVIDRVRNKGVLTVGDSDSFVRNGGMVGLVRTGDRVQIQVNLEATEQSHLKISSRLLNLSTIVQSVPAVRN
jgi:hypothetical protein